MASTPSTPYNQVTHVTPVMHNTERPSDSYLQRYFAHAEGFVPNKFHIGFSGEYVEKALTIMQVNCAGDKYTNAPKLFNGSAYLMKKFSNFIDDHWDNEKRILNMLWNCKSITLPKPTLTTAQIDSLDSMKDLTFNMPKRVQPGQLTLTVVDDQYLMWFNFFNAMFNSQISPLVLRPKSGFHKIDISVELLNGATADDWAVDMNKEALASTARGFLTTQVLGRILMLSRCPNTIQLCLSLHLRLTRTTPTWTSLRSMSSSRFRTHSTVHSRRATVACTTILA